MTPFHRSRPSVVSCFVFIALAGVAFTPLRAESAATDEPKDHVLFVGLDVSLQGPRGDGQIQSVSRTTLQVFVDGALETVALRDVSDVKTVQGPKVSSTVLTLSDPKGIRTYSPATNPGRDTIQQQLDTLFMQEIKMTQAEGYVKVAALAPSVQGGNSVANNAEQQRQQAYREAAATNMTSVEGSMRTDFFDPGSIANRTQGGAAKDLYDAYDVSFTIASPQPIDDAFAALVMIVRSPTTPNNPLQTVMFRQLPRITSEPRKIMMQQRGLPQGFAVDRVDVHVYANGRELASNFSARSVPVTRAEAHQFLLIRYLLENKHQNLPTALVPDFLPTDFATNVPEDAWVRTIDVHVSRDGIVESARLDPALSPSVSRYVDQVVRSARFFPALLDGEPVASESTVTLREFVR